MQPSFLIPVASALAMLATSAAAEEYPDIEMAARMNAAENFCDINWGPSIAFLVIDAARELGITPEEAARRADIRDMEIRSYLAREGKLDEFCTNARAGRL